MNAMTDEERERRKAAIDFARGSVRLEGFVLSDEAERLARSFVDGGLTLPEYVAAVLAISKVGEDSRQWDEGQITAARITEYHLEQGAR